RRARAAAACPQVPPGRGRVPLAARHPRALALPPGSSLRAAFGRHGSPRRLRARRVVERSLRRQLELARPRLVPHELPADRVAPEVPLLLRRCPEGPVSDGLDEPAQSLAGRDRAVPPPDPHLSARG